MRGPELERAIEAILFAAGDSMPLSRIALVLGVSKDEAIGAALGLMGRLESEMRGIRLIRLEGSVQLCSAPEFSDTINRAIEQSPAPKLSRASLEVLAIVAYFQPVTRAYIEQIRGVDSSYTVGVLTNRGLIETSGKLEVPGRPSLYTTNEAFLRIMGIESLSELPPLPDISSEEGADQLRQRIIELRGEGAKAQSDISEYLPKGSKR